MQTKILKLNRIIFLLLLITSTTAHSFSLFRSEAWAEAPNTTRPIADVGPGGATWSLVGDNVSSSLIDPHYDETHILRKTSLLTDINADIRNIVDNSFNIWASVSGFTNRGQRTDSNVAFGAAEPSSFGNIRIAAIGFDGPSEILGHAFSIDSSNSITSDKVKICG